MTGYANLLGEGRGGGETRCIMDIWKCWTPETITGMGTSSGKTISEIMWVDKRILMIG